MYTWNDQLLINEQDLYTIKRAEQDGIKKIASKQILKGMETYYDMQIEIPTMAQRWNYWNYIGDISEFTSNAGGISSN